MKIKQQLITPELAREMLAKNTRNRTMNMVYVKKLASEIKAGRWKMNGDTIRFNGNILIDGQHRLEAISMADQSVETLVIDGLESDVFDTIDIGRRRSAGDTLSVGGEINCGRLAATLICIEKYLTKKAHLGSHGHFSNTEVEEILKRHPGARHSVRICDKCMIGMISPSILSACHYLFSLKNSTLADNVVDQLRTGDGLSLGNPIHALRELLIRSARGRLRARNPDPYAFALLIRAWNHIRKGTSATHFKLPPELTAENFPIIA